MNNKFRGGLGLALGSLAVFLGYVHFAANAYAGDDFFRIHSVKVTVIDEGEPRSGSGSEPEPGSEVRPGYEPGYGAGSGSTFEPGYGAGSGSGYESGSGSEPGCGAGSGGEAGPDALVDSVRGVGPQSSFSPPGVPMPGFSVPEGNIGLNAIGDIDGIINTGLKIWSLIEANKPVVNSQVLTANAIPACVKDWSDMEGWKIPKSYVLNTQFKNLYGVTVVDFSYRIVFSYGGSLGGKGQYLSSVTVIPHNLSVYWTFKFSSSVAISGIMNAGTKENPLAAMQVDVRYQVDSTVSYIESSGSFYIRGDGLFENMSNKH